jgi:aryl-alcohol dehydrogenase-like predicted oxidoreductase
MRWVSCGRNFEVSPPPIPGTADTPTPVIATKYTTCYKVGNPKKPILANYTGNGSKSLFVSVNDSLKKLQTDYIDILYVHW